MSTFCEGRAIPLRPDPDALAASSMASLTRAAVAFGRARLDRSSTRVQQVRAWDDRTAEILVRAAVSPTTLSNTPALTAISVAFLDALRPASAGADLLSRGIGLNFNGSAQINVPGI